MEAAGRVPGKLGGIVGERREGSAQAVEVVRVVDVEAVSRGLSLWHLHGPVA